MKGRDAGREGALVCLAGILLAGLMVGCGGSLPEAGEAPAVPSVEPQPSLQPAGTIPAVAGSAAWLDGSADRGLDDPKPPRRSDASRMRPQCSAVSIPTNQHERPRHEKV